MSVEEIRQVFEEELGPELREIRKILSNMQRRLEFGEEIDRIRREIALRRLEFTHRSCALERRISALEANKDVAHDARATQADLAENAL